MPFTEMGKINKEGIFEGEYMWRYQLVIGHIKSGERCSLETKFESSAGEVLVKIMAV